MATGGDGGRPVSARLPRDTGNLLPPSRRERLYLPGSTSQFFQHDFQKDRLRRRRFRDANASRRGLAGTAMPFPEALPPGGGSWWE